MPRKRLSKAARAALQATGRDAPTRGANVDVLARLEEIDPAFARPRDNAFLADIARGKDGLDGLFQKLRADDPEERADAAEALGVICDKRALVPLREALSDPDGEVRTNAAVALIRVGDEQLFPEVVKSLRHEDPRVVIGAAVALGRLADARVVPNLVEAFKTEDPEVGAAVAWALGQCADASALPWLITAVEQGFATANACEALGRIGDPKAQLALIGALAHAADDVRAYAARSLGLLHYAAPSAARAEASSVARSVVELKQRLSDPSRKVRLCAAIALYELGEKLGGDALVDELSA